MITHLYTTGGNMKDVENDDALWPPLTNGKGRKEKKNLTK